MAKACTDSLGPAGYGYVQVSPPQEHIQGAQWWTSYQPVSYKIAGRLGDRAAFKNMVNTCHAAGVKVIADSVINHMSAGSGTGTGGIVVHQVRLPGHLLRPPTWTTAGRRSTTTATAATSRTANWSASPTWTPARTTYAAGSPATSTTCSRSASTASASTPPSTCPAADLANIKSRLSNPGVYWKHEAIYGAGEAVSPTEYLGSGDVQEFRYARDLKRVFNNENLAYLKNFGEGWGYMESGKSGGLRRQPRHRARRRHPELQGRRQLHPGERLHAGLPLRLARTSTPATSAPTTTPARPTAAQVNACYSDGWKCQHAWREISSMVGFRNAARGQAVTNWWDNGGDQIAFGRGSKAYVAINHEGSSLTRTFQTSLPAGDYCDVQSGKGVTVNGSGQFTATLGANTAVALHVGARTCAGGGGTTPDPGTGQSGASFGVNATTQLGQNIYVTGNQAALGSWAPGSALKLDPATYPVWKLDVALPAGTSFEYKYLRKDASGNVTWESGANRTATVPASGKVALTADVWRS